MSFDFKLLGRKIQQAREGLLMPPAEVANFLRISEAEYLGIEAGHREATGDEVILLAALFRRDFRYFVTGDYPSVESRIDEMYRRNGALSRADRIAIQEFARLCEYQAFLESVLGVQNKSLPDYSQHPFGHTHYKKQGAEGATLERDRLLLGRQPIEDIFAIMRGQGVRVFKRELEDSNISGLYLRHPVAGHCVLVNYLEDLYRQNFSAAHEYCHALFDSARGQQVSYWTQQGRQAETRRIDWRANSFAGSFLIPGERLERDYHRAVSYDGWLELVPRVARRFHTSSQPVVIRLREAGWIDEQTKDRLIADHRLVLKTSEKYDPEIPPELPRRTKERLTEVIRHGLSWHFLQLCANAYRRGEITYHRILEMLFLPIDEGIALLNEIALFLEVSEP